MPGNWFRWPWRAAPTGQTMSELDSLYLRRAVVLGEIAESRLGQLLGEIKALRLEVRKMTTEVQLLKDKVAGLTGAVQSAKSLIEGFAQLVRDNIDDKPALLKILDEVDADAKALADAVAANPLPQSPPV